MASKQTAIRVPEDIETELQREVATRGCPKSLVIVEVLRKWTEIRQLARRLKDTGHPA